jgi:hypothetical protein
MSRKLILPAALVGSLLATPALAKAQCHQEFVFQTNPLIGLSAIRKLVQTMPDKDRPHTEDGAELVVWPFDEEDHPTFGKYRGIAVVFATRGDLGEEGAGGLLLQDRSAPLLAPTNLTVEQSSGGVVLQLPARGSCPRFIVKLVDGGAISVQGRVVGRLH